VEFAGLCLPGPVAGHGRQAAFEVLIVIIPAPEAELIAATITAANSYTSTEIRATAEELEEQIIEAKRKSIADSHP